MFVTVVLLFGLCWFPYHFYFIYVFHHNHILQLPITQHVYFLFYFLAMGNSMINPIIYFFMNARSVAFCIFNLTFFPSRNFWANNPSKVNNRRVGVNSKNTFRGHKNLKCAKEIQTWFI